MHPACRRLLKFAYPPKKLLLLSLCGRPTTAAAPAHFSVIARRGLRVVELVGVGSAAARPFAGILARLVRGRVLQSLRSGRFLEALIAAVLTDLLVSSRRIRFGHEDRSGCLGHG